MAIKVYNPTTPSRRGMSVLKNDTQKVKPKKFLVTINNDEYKYLCDKANCLMYALDSRVKPLYKSE